MSIANDESTVKLSLLLLDDEQDILNSLKRLLRRDYDVVCYTEGQEALDYLADNNVDIIMSDMRMPQMNGDEFLTSAKKCQPDAIRILLTGYSDMESTINAINNGSIYTYIGKPWDNESLKLTLEKAASHYGLKKEKIALSAKLKEANDELANLNQSLEIRIKKRTAALEASKEKLNNSLSIQQDLMSDMLDMLSATIEYRTGFGDRHLKRIAKQSRLLAVRLELDEASCRRIYFCALIHEIGMVGLSDEVLANIDMSNMRDEAIARHPQIGAEIVGRIKRLTPLIDNILYQNENYDGTGTPGNMGGVTIPIGARIIRIVKDFDYLIAGNNNDKRMPVSRAKAWMKERANLWYDRSILEVYLEQVKDRTPEEEAEMGYGIGIESIEEGNILIEDIVLHNGNTMLKAGQILNAAMIDKLRKYEDTYNTKVTLFVD